MATFTKMNSYPDIQLPVRPEFCRKISKSGKIPVVGRSKKGGRRWCWEVCRAFKEEGDNIKKIENENKNSNLVLKIRVKKEIVSSIKSGIVRLCKWPSGDENRDALAELEKVLFSVCLLHFFLGVLIIII